MNRTIPITQFRNQCLRLMDEVKATGDTLIVTKHGRPLAAVIPIVDQRSTGIIGWSSEIRLGDDLTNPAIPPDDWEIVSHPDRIVTSLRGE